MAKPSKPAAATPASKPQSNPPSKPVARTEVRNSPVPQMAPPPRPAAAKTAPPRAAGPQAAATSSAAAARPAGKQVTHELIARRAYEIWASGQGGTEMENWIRAERELRGM